MKVGRIGKLSSRGVKKKSLPPPETFYVLTSDGKYLATSDGQKVVYKHD